MPQTAQQARKRYTVLNTIENVRAQTDKAKENPELPIVLETRSDLNNPSTLHLFFVSFDEASEEDEVLANSERGEAVSLFIPHRTDVPATVYIPN